MTALSLFDRLTSICESVTVSTASDEIAHGEVEALVHELCHVAALRRCAIPMRTMRCELRRDDEGPLSVDALVALLTGSAVPAAPPPAIRLQFPAWVVDAWSKRLPGGPVANELHATAASVHVFEQAGILYDMGGASTVIDNACHRVWGTLSPVSRRRVRECRALSERSPSFVDAALCIAMVGQLHGRLARGSTPYIARPTRGRR